MSRKLLEGNCFAVKIIIIALQFVTTNTRIRKRFIVIWLHYKFSVTGKGGGGDSTWITNLRLSPDPAVIRPN
jgi:hypothetical protein